MDHNTVLHLFCFIQTIVPIDKLCCLLNMIAASFIISAGCFVLWKGMFSYSVIVVLNDADLRTLLKVGESQMA
jgi:hypothetical protein